jgi:hypothetical protein
MNQPQMTLQEFEMHLDTHGAGLQRWPPQTAARGAALLETSVPARALHARALALATELDRAFPVHPLTTGALRARILDEVTRNAASHRGVDWLTGTAGWLRPMVLALIPLCLGFAIGVGYPEHGAVNDELISDASLFAFAAYEEDPDAQ